MPSVRPVRRALAALFVLVAGVSLAACTSQTTPTPTSTDEVNSGYVSGDGSVQTWVETERGEVVDLAGVDMSGEPVDIADWHGDVVVLNFWYAECPPCRKEAPDLAALADEFTGEAHFLGVNHTNEPETALAFERRFELTYPTLHDKDAAGVAAVQGIVPLQAMPSTVVLDARGRVAARIIGLADKSTLKTLIADTLAETA